MRGSVLVAVLLLAAVMAAQAESARPSRLEPWGGVPLELAGPDAPPVLVLVLAQSPACAVREAPPLRRLLDRHRGDGLRCVLVLPAPKAGMPTTGPDGLPAGLAGLDVCCDEGHIVRRLCGVPEPGADWFVLQRGVPCFAGRPEHGLEAVIQSALAAGLDCAAEAGLRQQREQLRDDFDDLDAGTVQERAERILRHRPTDGETTALWFLAAAELQRDDQAAAAVLQTALLRLAEEPRALARFCDLALRSTPCPPERGRILAAALGALAAKDDLVVELARLRALVRAGAGREVGRLAHALSRSVGSDATAAVELAAILASDEPAAVHKDLVATVLQRVDLQELPPRLRAAVRYLHALRCTGDRRAAAAIADDYLDGLDGRVTINNDAWYFLTELATRGRFDEFALVLVERMLEQQDAMDAFEFDTAALAMFRNGRLQRAVELQQQAIARGGRDEPGYQARLGRFRAAAAGAAPR